MNAFLRGIASIGEGMASFFDWGSPLSEKPEIREILDKTDAEAFKEDAEALRADWAAIESDYRKSFGQR